MGSMTLDALLTLPENWDGNGALAPKKEWVETARLYARIMPPLTISVGSDGDVEMMWCSSILLGRRLDLFVGEDGVFGLRSYKNGNSLEMQEIDFLGPEELLPHLVWCYAGEVSKLE